jgi:AcrR family transcriptional regulator
VSESTEFAEVVHDPVEATSDTSGRDPHSRQRIMNAAFEVMAERGYAGATISLICKRSGLAPSSTYWHFGSKDGLLAAVVDDASRRWLARMPRWSDLQGGPEQRIEALMMGVADAIIADPMPSRLFLLLALELRPSAPQLEQIRSTHANAGRAVRRAIRELNPDASVELEDRIVSLVLSTANGAVAAGVLDPQADVRVMMRDVATSVVQIAKAG